MKFFSTFLRLPQWILSAACFALILYLTLAPKPLPDNDLHLWEHTDKLVHTIMFGALYVCSSIDIWRLRKCPPLWPSLILASAITVFGGTIEILQQAMQLGRGGSVADFVADIIGIAMALLLMRTRAGKL